MATCDVCGEHVNMPYTCRHCGGVHCSKHRLPENHNCPGLDQWNDPSGVFDSGFDDSITQPDVGGSDTILDRIGINTGAGGPLGYFRNNVAFLFLGIMVIVFGIQYIVAPLFGVRPPTGPILTPEMELWRDIFTANTANPHYVWTWIISVFSHGSPMHLLFNAIVLYFFGPIVEKQVGSKAFAALFFVAGVVSGVAQVGVGLLLGETVSVLGASGALMAILGVLAITSPNLKVLLFFFIPMSIRTLTILFAVFSIVAFLSRGGIFSGVAHFAHLTGLVIGLWYGNRIKHRVRRGPRQLNIGPRGPGGPGRRGPGRP
ncbi:MAG: rhomboid family intramembrane serine protease [Natronomonas sp.]